MTGYRFRRMDRSNRCVLRSKRFSNSLEQDTRLIFKPHKLWLNFCPGTSNNSPPPLIVTMTALGGLSPRSKRMGISQMYIKLWHELLRATLLALTLYNIYIYRHESP